MSLGPGRPFAADPPPHGTRARYSSTRWPCRCPECKGANNGYMAAYRAAAARPVRRPVLAGGAVQLELPPHDHIRVGR